MKRLGAPDGNPRTAESGVQRLTLSLPVPEQRLEALQFRVWRGYPKCGQFFIVQGCILAL
jgi:hypothetical protein